MKAKHIKFAKEYVNGADGGLAARKAGYKESNSHSQSSKLLALPEVRSYINELKKQHAAKAQIDSGYVLLKIKNVLEIAEVTGHYKIVLKAAELLGKHLKLFTDVYEHNVTYTQMGTVTLVDKTGEETPMTFNVGQPAKPNPQLKLVG